MTDQKVNITKYTHRDAREGARNNNSYGVVYSFFTTARFKKTSCLATKFLHDNYLVVTIKIY